MGGVSVINSVSNQKATPAMYSDVLANRPAAGFRGRLFVSTDTLALYRDNGTGWDLIGGPGTGTITGSGTPEYVTKWDGVSSIADSVMYFDGSSNLIMPNQIQAASFFATGEFLVDGSSGGDNQIFWDGVSFFVIASDFDNVKIQGGINNANKRTVGIYIGTDLSAEWDINGNQINTGDITAAAFITTGGTAAEFVKGDGSLDSNTYLTQVSLPATQVGFGDGSNQLTGSANLTWDGSDLSATGFVCPAFTPGGLLFSNGSDRIVQDTANIYWDDTNNRLGVRTNAPAYPLHVVGDALIENSAAVINGSQWGLIQNLALSGAGVNNGANQYAYAGALGQISFNSTGTTTYSQRTHVAGVVGKTYYLGTGTYTKGAAVLGVQELKDTANVTDLSVFYAQAPFTTALGTYTGTITNFYGLFIDNITGNSDLQARITNKWGVYQSGASDVNYFAGQTRIGSASNINAQFIHQVTGSQYVSGQTAQTYSISADLYVSLNSNVDTRVIAFTGNTSGPDGSGNTRVIIEYVAGRNSGGTIDYESARLVVFGRSAINSVFGVSKTDVIGTNYCTFSASYSSGILSVFCNPGVFTTSCTLTFKVTVICAGSSATFNLVI